MWWAEVSDAKPTASSPLFTNVRNRNPKTQAQFGFDKYVDNKKLTGAGEDSTFMFALRPAKAVGTADGYTVAPMPKSTDCVRTTKLPVPLYDSVGKAVMDGEDENAKQVMVDVESCVVKNGKLESLSTNGTERNIWFPQIEYTAIG